MTARVGCATIREANSNRTKRSGDAMATEAITIKVDSEAARVFNSARGRTKENGSIAESLVDRDRDGRCSPSEKT